MNTDTALVCNMGVFTPEQREAHILNTTQLIQSLRNIQELENGYEFLFPDDAVLLAQITEFISNERLCCPFLEFTLHVYANEPTALRLTGPMGTQEFLRSEFNGAFQ